MAGVDVWFFVFGAAVLTETPQMPNTVGPLTEQQCHALKETMETKLEGDKDIKVASRGTCQHAIDKRDCPLTEEEIKKGVTACPVWIFEAAKK